MVRQLVVVAGTTVAVVLAGCGSGAPSHGPAPPRKPSPPLVYLHDTNGADPIAHETTVTRDGRVRVVVDAGRAGGRRDEVRLGAGELARLRRLVARTPLAHADRSTRPTPGGSTYIMRIGHRTAVFSTGHVAPRVRPLLAVLLRLSERVLREQGG